MKVINVLDFKKTLVSFSYFLLLFSIQGHAQQVELSIRMLGNGIVTSSPAGINCGGDCTALYPQNTVVNLSVTPASGYRFKEWRGACQGSAGCSVVMSENQLVGAVFTSTSTSSSFRLDTLNTAQGLLTSLPGGINCGSDCSETFTSGTQVVVSAIPQVGFTVSRWLGDCTGSSGNTCTLTMSKNQRAGVEYEADSSPTNHALTVNAGAGGQVTSSPSGINCGSDCTQEYAENTLVTLTATADQGFQFSEWRGACLGTSVCNVTMNADQNVTADFIAIPNGILSITDMGLHTVAYGDTFTYQPIIQGEFSICRKDLGHDDVRVDSETGRITWDTSSLAFGRGFHIRIKCSSFTEFAYGSMVVHVDRTGTSQLRIAGNDGVSEYIGIAGQAMTSGDTIVFPDGLYPVSVTLDESFENAFKRTAPTAGLAIQFSTLIARNPGGVIISGAPHSGLPKQKNIFQFAETNNVAIMGFVLKDSQRESLTNVGAGNHLLIDFVGAAGAGTEGRACATSTEAAAGACSNAGMRINSGTPLFQNSYDWGHNRYGIMTRNSSGSVTRRSFVRLDEHKGDQPYGGFSNYCDSAHLSQDNTVFDSLAIAAPHYKNYAGLEAYPATGCENVSADLKTEGLLAVNNDLSLSLMDQQVGPEHVWDNIVSYDSEGTCTPAFNRCGGWLLQADKTTLVRNSFFGMARGFGGGTNGYAFDAMDVVLEDSVAIDDVPGVNNVGQVPEYLPQSLLYFRGRSDTFYGDEKVDELTQSRRWPIPGEDIIAANMRSYFNAEALKVGGGTVVIDGNRGAVSAGNSMSEYFWGYNNELVPPLVVRVKSKATHNRIAWEHLSGAKRDDVQGWKVICATAGNMLVAQLNVDQLTYLDNNKSCEKYAVLALYAEGESGYAYAESPVQDEQVLLSDYTEIQPVFALSQFGNNGSGITWHENLNQYLVVRNSAGIIYRYDSDFNFLGQITRAGNMSSDMEGLAYLEGDQVMIVTEANVAHKTTIDAQTTVVSGNYGATPAYRLLPTPVSNKGLEAVAVRPATTSSPARIYACQEGTISNSSALMEFVYFDMPSPDVPELLSYDSNLTVIEPFDAEQAFAGEITDCSGMAYDVRTGHVIIVSQESSKAIQIDPETGEIISQLALSGANWYEGVTFGPNGELVFASEPNEIHIFQR